MNLIIRKYKIYLIALVINGSSLFSQAQKLTLTDVIEMAKQQSIAAKQASAARETKYWEYKSFLANYKPQLIFQGNLPAFNRSFKEVVQPDGTIEFQPVRYNNSSLNLSLNQIVSSTGGSIYAASQIQRFDDFDRNKKLYNGLPFGIGYEQPLFRFNTWSWDKKIEPLKFNESRQTYIESMESISIKANQYFFELLLAQVNLQIAETNLGNTENILKITKEKFDIGKTSRNEILQLELENLNSKKAIGTAKRDLEISTLNLKSFIGLQNDNKIELLAPLQVSGVTITADKAMQEAFDNRSDAISYQRMIMEADKAIAKAKGDNGLNATLSVSLGFSNRANALRSIYVHPKDQENINLELSIPVVDWGRSKSRLITAQVQKQLTEYTVEQEKQNFRQSIYTQVTLYEMLKSQLDITAKADSIASEKYDIAKDRYLLGNLSITDLSIAFQEKDQSKRDNINALRDYWGAYYQLRALTLYDFEINEKIK